MNEIEVISALEDRGAIQEGHFKLSSGLHSDRYVQCALALQWPGLAERLGHDLAGRFGPAAADVVVAPAMGGIVIGHEVARHLDVRMVFSERVDGAMRLRRGFALRRGERALVVDDVVTTGRSPRETIGLVEESGAAVVGVGAIIDRTTSSPLAVRFEALARVRAAVWEADDCPLCARGAPLTAPGSRYIGVEG